MLQKNDDQTIWLAAPKIIMQCKNAENKSLIIFACIYFQQLSDWQLPTPIISYHFRQPCIFRRFRYQITSIPLGVNHLQGISLVIGLDVFCASGYVWPFFWTSLGYGRVNWSSIKIWFFFATVGEKVILVTNFCRAPIKYVLVWNNKIQLACLRRI